jgi:hypothetical protein
MGPLVQWIGVLGRDTSVHVTGAHGKTSKSI